MGNTEEKELETEGTHSKEPDEVRKIIEELGKAVGLQPEYVDLLDQLARALGEKAPSEVKHATANFG